MYIKFKHGESDYHPNIEVERRQISSLSELADILEKTEVCLTWIEGLGVPESYHDVRMWKTFGQTIRKLLDV